MQNQLTQLELQHLRELISGHDLANKKLTEYANQCTDQQLKQMLQQSAQSALNTKQQLLSFLQ
ncbi:hypothetical protein BHF71_09470 [Vulcanibacillus modesticaldus]|uniref:Spore coat protein n=1 Tax=Vulcanibacillus modesticaldus TaxID=337097 RepID=A0A1D2YU76_9BACI|nr:hypothetical protein [Vulcanibacillus modesticaldus]OEF99254.1 hypothetical protein BHF71_09470 [Vulcanibacillus modesticaldus]